VAIENRRLGVAINGLGGAVASTMIAGLELIRQGLTPPVGLPLDKLPKALTAEMARYDALIFAGWDLCADDLATAARTHRVLPREQIDAIEPHLAALKPWPGIADEHFCSGVVGMHVRPVNSNAAAVEAFRTDLRAWRKDAALDGLVLLNLASVEATADPQQPAYQTIAAFEQAIADNSAAIGPAALACYAAILEGVPYINFTPSFAGDLPALRLLAAERNVPVMGKDGKTGQTFIKTVLAPGFRDRALDIEGWFSTNILGNRDGEALRSADSLASKLGTKTSVLDTIMGGSVDNHLVHIHYYKPRGDEKEAWDSIDLVGFGGQRMQMKVNFQCRDSILAAPLAIELCRLADLAQRHGEGGVIEAASEFFKSPMTSDGRAPEHDFFRQHGMLVDWLTRLAKPKMQPLAAE